MNSGTSSRLSSRQRGDFQTPENLAVRVWETLDVHRFDLVIEPTFGLGSFLKTIPNKFKGRILGWELHNEYYESTVDGLNSIGKRNVTLVQKDVFTASVSDLDISSNQKVLVVGNPPWVTNAEQGSLGGGNTGTKRNLKLLSGLDAMTGKSNFDISEAIILHFVRLLSQRCHSVEFALLTKFTVLRNLIQFLSPLDFIGDYEFHRIDAAFYFGASVDAGLLKFKIAEDSNLRQNCIVYDEINGKEINQIGLVNNKLTYDLKTYRRCEFLESNGVNHYIWRQGIKHDLSRILELREVPEGLVNGLGESVEVEDSVLYRLYKSSDIHNGRDSRFVIPIYQKDLKDTLEDLPTKFPKLYSYLTCHKALFDSRKSRIYRNRPPFSIFGVGDYSHSRYKVVVSGFYSEPTFRLIETNSHPVIVDDTCYMLATDNYDEAVYLLAILSLECTRDFLCSISHENDKRRFSKDVLSRLIIPPMRDCSPALVSQLNKDWKSFKEFSADTRLQIQSWLETYKSGSNLRLNFEPS